MASVYKTPNLGLNNWIGADTPLREDFNRDNTLVDQAIGQHRADGAVHLSAADRALFGTPFVTGRYDGNDAQSRTIGIGFIPRFGIIYPIDAYLCEYSSDLDTTNCGLGFITPLGGSVGVTQVSGGFMVNNYESGMLSSMPVLNRSGVAYVYVMWK